MAFTYILALFVTVVAPSLGPCFLEPGRFQFLAGSNIAMTQQGLWSLYMHNVEKVSQGEPIMTHAFTGIAAFPSLHVGHMAIIAVASWHISKVYMCFMWFMLVLTTIATIGFGWHYLVDAPAGAMLGALVTLVLYSRMQKWKTINQPAE